MSSGRLAGKVAIITGAARGQGEAEARLFITEGASVVLTDVLSDEAASVAASLGDRAIALRHDVTDAGQWREVVGVAESEFGRLDILVNNAAIHRSRALLDEDIDDMRRVMDVNLFGTVLGMQTAVPAMVRAGGGSIVNISSLAGYRGIHGHSAYGASKWAIRGVSRDAAIEFGPLGIRVNTVIPGAIATAMFPSSGDRAADDARMGHTPLGRVGDVEEVARAVLHFASDESSFTTGAELVVDGGSYAGSVPPGTR